MVKHKIIIIPLALVFIMLLAALILLKMQEPKPKYSDNPRDWIQDTKQGDYINVTKSTETYIDQLGQQFNTPEIETVFPNDGIYLGRYFRDTLVENNKPLIRFSQTMDPRNNVPEIFIMMRPEDGYFYAYIFVDEDWRVRVGRTNIIWGKSYQFSRELEFRQVKQGIYMDKIEDDMERYMFNYKTRFGGIIVGKITNEELRSNNFNHAIFVRIT